MVQLMLTVVAAGAVFCLVPRAVGAGEIAVHSNDMSWNTTRGTYSLRLQATLTLTNPNFLKAHPPTVPFCYVNCRVFPQYSYCGGRYCLYPAMSGRHGDMGVLEALLGFCVVWRARTAWPVSPSRSWLQAQYLKHYLTIDNN